MGAVAVFRTGIRTDVASLVTLLCDVVGAEYGLLMVAAAVVAPTDALVEEELVVFAYGLVADGRNGRGVRSVCCVCWSWDLIHTRIIRS